MKEDIIAIVHEEHLDQFYYWSVLGGIRQKNLQIKDSNIPEKIVFFFWIVNIKKPNSKSMLVYELSLTQALALVEFQHVDSKPV